MSVESSFFKNCGFNRASSSNMLCVEPAKTLRHAGARTAVSGPLEAGKYWGGYSAAKISTLRTRFHHTHHTGRPGPCGPIKPSDFAHRGRHPSPHKARPLPYRDAGEARPSDSLLPKMDSWRTWPKRPGRKS